MKKIILAILVVLLSSNVFANETIKRLSAVSDALFVPKVPAKRVLSNGMTVYAMEDRSLPIFQGRILIKGGSAYLDVEKDGVADVMANLLKNGGTTGQTPVEVREFLDENAIDVSFSASAESVEGAFSALVKNRSLALAKFFEMLFSPRFDALELSIAKHRIMDGLKREDQISGPIAHKNYRELVYGKNNVWGHIIRPGDIKKIDQKDVRALYDSTISPDRMILAVAGDFKKEDLFDELEKFAKSYPKKDLPPLKMRVPNKEMKEETKIISRKFTQSAISMGHLATTRDNPDKFALIVLNDIFGGSSSFSNRLTDTVRVKGGLAYEIWSNYGFGPKDVDGLFEIHAKTRNQTTSKAIEIIKSETEKIQTGGVTAAELQRAKDGLLKALVFQYERPFEMVKAVASFVHYGYPENYIDIYKREIERLNVADVNTAAKKYLHPDKLKVVIVGHL